MENSRFTSTIRQNIQFKDTCTTSEACVFLPFPPKLYFYCIQHSVSLRWSVRQDRVDFKQSCLIEQHITLPAYSTFEAPCAEHAQWHPVNKLLVEALMAVAHLVRLCTDPESDQGPPASSYRFKGQTRMRNVLDDKLKNR